MVSRICAALAASGLFALSSANAQERVTDWSGFYAGAHAGFVQDDTDGVKLDVNGGTAGIHVGYNAQFNQVVAGIEGDYTWTNSSDSVTVPLAAGFGNATISADLNYLASIRGRLGLATSSGLMFYGTAGYGWSELELTAVAPLANASIHRTVNFGGLVAGLGAEYQFTPMISGRVEGLKYFLDQQNGSGELNEWTARAGLSVRFPTH